MEHKLYIFDFDDTLVSSNAMIKILDSDQNEVRALTSEEYADSSHPKQLTPKEKKLGFTEDFADFDTYPPDGETLPAFDQFLSALGESPGNVHVLSARSATEPMQQFLNDNGASGFQVTGVGGSAPALKSRFVLSVIEKAEEPFTSIEVFEDSGANLSAIESAVKNKHPDINFIANHITTHKESLLRKFIRVMLLNEATRSTNDHY